MTFRFTALLALWTMLSGPVFTTSSRPFTPSFSSSAEGKNVAVREHVEVKRAHRGPERGQFGGMAFYLRQQLSALAYGE